MALLPRHLDALHSESKSQPCFSLFGLGHLSPSQPWHLDLPSLCLFCLVSAVMFSATERRADPVLVIGENRGTLSLMLFLFFSQG